jgi:hypothetical protein
MESESESSSERTISSPGYGDFDLLEERTR